MKLTKEKLKLNVYTAFSSTLWPLTLLSSDGSLMVQKMGITSSIPVFKGLKKKKKKKIQNFDQIFSNLLTRAKAI